MTIRPILIIGLLVPTSLAWAQVSDDSDLTRNLRPDAVGRLRQEGRREPGAIVFTAERLANPASGQEEATQEDRISGRILITDANGTATPGRRIKVLLWGDWWLLDTTETDEAGAWSLPKPSGNFRLRARLENSRWSLRDAETRDPYEWEIGVGTFRINLDSASGKIAAVHRQYLSAVDALSSAGISLDWWNQAVSVYYPSDKNDFSSDSMSIRISRAEAWDVNLHELGHAIMALGTNSYGGGGNHRISQCYNQGLAWSEGWATFVAAVAHFDPADSDPRFEYLAGGIPIENVPDTVCHGDTNEWRVAAALWDLYDSHEDGSDHFSMSLARLWQAIRGRSMGGFQDAWYYIQRALQTEEVAGAEGALEQNTIATGTAVASAPQGGGGRIAAPERSLGVLSAPDFDAAALR